MSIVSPLALGFQGACGAAAQSSGRPARSPSGAAATSPNTRDPVYACDLPGNQAVPQEQATIAAWWPPDRWPVSCFGRGRASAEGSGVALTLNAFAHSATSVRNQLGAKGSRSQLAATATSPTMPSRILPDAGAGRSSPARCARGSLRSPAGTNSGSTSAPSPPRG